MTKYMETIYTKNGYYLLITMMDISETYSDTETTVVTFPWFEGLPDEFIQEEFVPAVRQVLKLDENVSFVRDMEEGVYQLRINDVKYEHPKYNLIDVDFHMTTDEQFKFFGFPEKWAHLEEEIADVGSPLVVGPASPYHQRVK